MSLMLDKRAMEWEVLCKICLYECPQSLMVKLEDCGCTFCRDVSIHIYYSVDMRMNYDTGNRFM